MLSPNVIAHTDVKFLQTFVAAGILLANLNILIMVFKVVYVYGYFKGLRLPVCQDTWPPGSRLAGIFGLPPGEVAIDRSRPLVALPDSTLPNLVAVSESSSALMPSSNDDATVINLEQVLNFRNNVRLFWECITLLMFKSVQTKNNYLRQKLGRYVEWSS